MDITKYTDLEDKFTTYGSGLFLLKASTSNGKLVQYIGKLNSQDEVLAVEWISSEIKRPLGNRETITFGDGSKVWIERAYATSEIGGYVWHSDGNRVQATRILVEKSADGRIVRKHLPRTVWVKHPSFE